MTEPDSLEKLARFYQTLDAIPTPPLMPKVPRNRGLWGFAFAPLGALIGAYGFISFCAMGPTVPTQSMPVQMVIGRYALRDIKPPSIVPKSNTRALGSSTKRTMI